MAIVKQIVKDYDLKAESLLKITEVGTLRGLTEAQIKLVHDRLLSAITERVILLPKEQGAPQNG
jgi:hypothetical protein